MADIKVGGDYVGRDKTTNDPKIYRWLAAAFVALCAAFSYAAYYVATMDTDTAPVAPEINQEQTE